MPYTLSYQYFGQEAILISWPQHIDKSIRTDVHQFNQKIQKYLTNFIIETVPAYCSLTLFIKPEIPKKQLINKLKKLYTSRDSVISATPKIHEIPVCYDLSLGIDLEYLSTVKKCSIDDIIDMHTKEIYEVDFLGFLPGFPYLSGLNPLLATPRLTKPRIKIPKGSVAIGGNQTGIYPMDSPGGWHIIGRTPTQLFNPNKLKPCLLKPLDKIKFTSISLKALMRLMYD